MSPTPPERRRIDPAEEDPRLVAAVREYVAAVEAGHKPNRQEFIARHPDVAAELSECLQGLAFVQSAAARMHGSSSATETQAGISGGVFSSAQPLGDFKLIREIGRGGMGVVYEAVQLSLGRHVALKVLPMAAALDARHLQRFKNEAQAAAQLHHTNIVPVYAVGYERSVHFYAMQLIDGQSLAEIIRTLRQITGRDIETSEPALPLGESAAASSDIAGRKSGLSSLHAAKRPAYFRDVAQLALQAADALDYAHQLGVVHRDIKPANLLLDLRGTLWITDFGLAQFYADNGLTQTGDLVGTIRYMSPEQASGRAVVLDQRTDIYSLGVTLYELLTLERAVPGETRQQLLHQITALEPRPMRSIDRTIPRELQIIVAKAIAKEPAERYATARAFADDLRRFLSDKPILARPPSPWNKAAKWARRHKSLALPALTVLILAASGLFFSTLLIARQQMKTREAYVQERSKAAEANEQRGRADHRYQQAREAVDFFSRVAAEEMDWPEFTQVRKELLATALDYYQEFLQDRKDDPSDSGELSAARAHIAALLRELAAFDELGRVQSRAMLLDEPSIQQALSLSPAQIDKAHQLVRETIEGRGRPDPHEQDRLTPDLRRQRSTIRAQTVEASLDALLTPNQADRLLQISRQLRGAAAFSDPDVADILALTREQKELIRTAQARYRNVVKKLSWELGPWKAESSDAMQHARADAVAAVLPHLTSEQNQHWKLLIGPPFTGQLSARTHGFGPGDFGGPPPPLHDHDHGGPPPPPFDDNR